MEMKMKMKMGKAIDIMENKNTREWISLALRNSMLWSTYTRYWKSKESLILLALSTGSIISFCCHGYIQEKITINRTNSFQEEILLLLFSSFIYLLISGFLVVSLTLAKGQNTVKSNAPVYVYAILTCTCTLSIYMSICSLRYITYPMKVLGKTCKPLALITAGKIIGKHYCWRQCCSIGLIVCGAILFYLTSQKSNSTKALRLVHSHWKGVALLSLSLIFDAVTGLLEDKYMAQFRIHPMVLMRNINIWSLFFLVLVLQASLGIGTDGIFALRQSIEQFYFWFVLLGVAGGFGQIFTFIILSRYQAVSNSIIGTVRKVFTVSISIISFGHCLTAGQQMALPIIVAGLMLNLSRFRMQTVSTKVKDEEEEISINDSMEKGINPK